MTPPKLRLQGKLGIAYGSRDTFDHLERPRSIGLEQRGPRLLDRGAHGVRVAWKPLAIETIVRGLRKDQHQDLIEPWLPQRDQVTRSPRPAADPFDPSNKPGEMSDSGGCEIQLVPFQRRCLAEFSVRREGPTGEWTWETKADIASPEPVALPEPEPSV